MKVFVSLRMVLLEIPQSKFWISVTITFVGLSHITRLLESTRIKTINLENNNSIFNDEACTQRFARVLSRHEFLKELGLSECRLGNDTIRIITNALDGNTIIKVLDIGWNHITSIGLAHITRLLESTKLQKVNLQHNRRLFNNEAFTQGFALCLSRHEFLKELGLSHCRLGDGGIRIITNALVGNEVIEILDIGYNSITSNGLDDITRLLESTKLRKLNLQHNSRLFNVDATTQRFAHVLTRHKFLKELGLSECRLGDTGIRIIVDGLVGNSIMEVLNINYIHITAIGLDDITRLLLLTQVKTISFGRNFDVFNERDATERFISTLQHKQSSVQDLGIDPEYFPFTRAAEYYASINNSLSRSRQLNHVDLLLLAPRQQQQRQRNDTTMLLKISQKAITKFAKVVPNNAVASAIFKLFQARPQLLEKRIKRPTAVDVAVSSQAAHSNTSNSILEVSSLLSSSSSLSVLSSSSSLISLLSSSSAEASTTNNQPNKRQRL